MGWYFFLCKKDGGWRYVSGELSRYTVTAVLLSALLKDEAMRFKQHETQQDLSNESGVAAVIERAWQCGMRKLPKSYRLDFMAVRGDDACAFVEVKCRRHQSDTYPTVMLSLSKVLQSNALTKATGCPCFFVARFTDGVYYYDLSGKDYKTQWGGRTKSTRDARDIEPIVLIPIASMQRIPE
tara:strand:- start:5810 stop:6355 length:546 start_codon:yes stop_codon:yes gene_type:complete